MLASTEAPSAPLGDGAPERSMPPRNPPEDDVGNKKLSKYKVELKNDSDLNIYKWMQANAIDLIPPPYNFEHLNPQVARILFKFQILYDSSSCSLSFFYDFSAFYQLRIVYELQGN